MKLSKTCLRLFVGLPKHRFTEGGNAGGAGTAALEGAVGREEFWDGWLERASIDWRFSGDFVPLLFDIDSLSEEICGRSGRHTTKKFAYRPISASDDMGVSFTVCRLAQARTMNG